MLANKPLADHRPAILLVDDRPENLLVLEKLLEDLDVRLVKASSGNEALSSVVQEENLILMLLDVNMPEMDGYEVLEILHTNEGFKKIPVIFITAYYTDEGHRLKGYELGAVDYLYKPIDESILLSKVKIFLEMYKSREENVSLQRRNQLILDSAGEGIFGLDTEGYINFINPAAATMLGWDSKQIINKSLKDILPENEFVAEAYDWKQTEIYQASFNGYFDRKLYKSFLKKDQKEFPVDYVITSLRDEQDRYLGAVIVFTDATQRIENEKNIKHIHQSQRIESLGQLTGGIAHDFNNILMTIQGNLELLAMRFSESDKDLKHVNSALNGVKRGASLTKRLLAFARKQTLFPKKINLNQQLQSIVELLAPTLGEMVNVNLSCEQSLWPIWVDSNEFDNAIINMAINARDAMPSGGSIYIEAKNTSLDKEVSIGRYQVSPGDYVNITITDHGTGMDKDTMSHIFEPFYTTKGEGKGTGLGLSMVYGFITQSKGTITVYSEIGHGTTFGLYFPKLKDESESVVDAPKSEVNIAGDETILVVEDEFEVCALVTEYLNVFGYKVLSAPNAKEALELLETNRDIHMLFTDMVMPGGMNGVELAKKAREYIPEIKVLITSGYPKSALEKNDISLEEHIMKPYKLDTLLVQIREILDRT